MNAQRHYRQGRNEEEIILIIIDAFKDWEKAKYYIATEYTIFKTKQAVVRKRQQSKV